METTINKIVALYIRVSTDEQAEQGFSIDSQKERLAAYCKAQGWDNFRYYIDDGYTGTNINRPSLQRLTKHIQEGKIATVVVYRLDRLSRKQKDVLYLLEDVFDKGNCHFKSATEPFDTSTPLGKAMLGILAVFAQLERDTIVERTTSGRRQRIRNGLWFGGRVPFGYDWNSETQQLTINPMQAELFKTAVSMYLRGNSRMQIAEYLASKSNDRVFDHSVVRDMLARPIYAGLLPTHDGSVVNGNHDGIIDLDTWTRIQEESRRRAGKRPIGDNEKQHLLSGILECGLCGGPMYKFTRKTNANGKTYEYNLYACKNQHIRKKDRTIENCQQGYKNVDKLDELVIRTLQQYTLSPELLIQEVESMQEHVETNETIIKQLESKLKDIEQKLDRWYSAFEDGELDPRMVKKRTAALEEEKKQLEERLQEMEMHESEAIDSSKTFQAITAISDAWDEMTTSEQQQALRMLIDKVIVHPDWSIQIKWAT